MLSNNFFVAAEGDLSGDGLTDFINEVPSGIWDLLAYMGGALIVIALVMAAWGFIQQAAQGGRGGGGGNQQLKTLGKMIVFGVLLAGPNTWLPVAISLVADVLNVILDLLGNLDIFGDSSTDTPPANTTN